MPLKPMQITQASYPIVICGPGSPRLRVDTDAGDAIVSTNGVVYPASVLERAAPVFENVPCYHRHEGGVLRDKIGIIQNPRWDAASAELLADLLVTSPDWLRELSGPWRSIYGFSLAANTRCRTVEGLTFVYEISSVESVDLVDWTEAAAGGRWLDKGGVPAEILDRRIGGTF